MRNIRSIVFACFILSVLSISSQNTINSKLLSCNAIEAKGTLFQIDDNDETVNIDCRVNFHYNLKSQLFPEGGWYLMLYCPQLDLNESEQCGSPLVSINKETENFSPTLGKAIEIKIGPNELASLLFIPSLKASYPVFGVSISGHNYGIAVKDCTFVKVGNHKREKIEVEYTKATLSDILDKWFNIVSLK